MVTPSIHLFSLFSVLLYLKKKMLMVLFLKMTIPKCFAQKRANQNTSIAVSAVSLGII